MPDQPYHHGDLKAQLIAQGLQLLDTEGYQSFSLRKVAKRCGVSQTAPYRHFQNKDELIGAIASQALDAFAKSLEDAVARHPGSPREQLEEMGVAYIRFFAAKPEYLRLLFLTDTRLRLLLFEDERLQKHNASFSILQRVIERNVAESPAGGLSQDEMLLSSWGLVHGIATLLATGELKNDEQTLLLAERIVRGFPQPAE